ncbi:hypothetical protein DPM19_33640 [Actinomadura craniellae]|uniref:Uncharacterized protein n=1 Tax=Actinomadura craniellae TaxID=2231787 RepID=A0A365GXT8_9ACTN|nr:DUF6339 family protein [Actinomadura craniellae]RAY10743.1 hypothetical protein DPM19_33640 [Actinomadura craniellae]
MGFLYPRLLSGQAKPLHEAYQTMAPAELTDRVGGTHDSAVFAATGGDRTSEKDLRRLREKVVALAQGSNFPEESTRELRSTFDLKLAKLLHTEMGIVPAEAASGDVWAFLALVLLPDVAYWRYPSPPGDRVLGTDLTRHVFGRLWWRAHLVHSPGDPDPYSALSILGEAAFDQIYARRKALGGSPYLVKAILRVWDSLNLHEFKERQVLIDFLMRLLRLGPFVAFEALNTDALDAELRSVVEESVRAILKATSASPQEIDARVKIVLSGSALGHAPSVSPRKGPTVIRTSLPAATTDEASRRQDERTGLRVSPAPYSAYEGPSFGDPRVLGLKERAEAVETVVRAEGPVTALRVFRIITGLAGTRLRESAARHLVEATKYAVRRNMLAVENQVGRRGYLGATLHMPDGPSCVLRTRGPRALDEIPDRELVAAANLAQAASTTLDLEELAKRTSQIFGYERSTAPFKECLFDALQKHGR